MEAQDLLITPSLLDLTSLYNVLSLLPSTRELRHKQIALSIGIKIGSPFGVMVLEKGGIEIQYIIR